MQICKADFTIFSLFLHAAGYKQLTANSQFRKSATGEGCAFSLCITRSSKIQLAFFHLKGVCTIVSIAGQSRSPKTRQRIEAGDKRRYRDIFKEVYAQLKANIASASTKGQVRGK